MTQECSRFWRFSFDSNLTDAFTTVNQNYITKIISTWKDQFNGHVRSSDLPSRGMQFCNLDVQGSSLFFPNCSDRLQSNLATGFLKWIHNTRIITCSIWGYLLNAYRIVSLLTAESWPPWFRTLGRFENRLSAVITLPQTSTINNKQPWGRTRRIAL